MAAETDALHMAVLRSPHAYAELTASEIRTATTMPDVAAVLIAVALEGVGELPCDSVPPGMQAVGFVVSWVVRLWRWRREPFLVVSPEGIASPGFAGTLPWLAIQAVSVSALSARIVIVLRRGAPLPPRTRRIRRLQHDVQRHAIDIAGMLPRGMSAAALQAMLLRQAQAAHARRRLTEPAS